MSPRPGSCTAARGAAVALLAAALAGACGWFEAEPAELPTPAAVLALYQGEYAGVEDAQLSGNVVELRVRQPAEQLHRGGSLWARVGPYVYIFSPRTRELLETYPDVAAVRVVTLGPAGESVARATLLRDALTDIRWRRSLNILGRALQEGTERPSLLEDLVRWGEEHTEFEYDPEYVPR